MGAGFPINWAMQGQKLLTHPLYIKYNSNSFGGIDGDAVKQDLSGVLATADNAEICAYLSWLLRTLALVA